MSAMLKVALPLALVAGVALAAQHNFTPAEVENGGRLYQSTCAGCHGIAGDQLPGVALRSGKFRRGTTDEEISRIIRTGVPGTGMAAQAVAFLERANWLTRLDTVAWDSSWLLSEKSIAGRAMHTLIGYTDQPTEMQLLVYLGVLVVTVMLMWLTAPEQNARAAATG